MHVPAIVYRCVITVTHAAFNNNIYHALINTLSAHLIHINLNMIFYTHVEHSSTKTIYVKYYMEKQTNAHTTHTHTPQWICVWHWSVSYIIDARTHLLTHTHTHTQAHTDCSRYWVLILVGEKILWEENGFQFGFKRCFSPSIGCKSEF